ncbi:hypothetical protein niasHT_029478 [Heterodera trifolii]|uniref:Uncharacterized protein n=1 Tax=Heterodera trifolii TaxID=157864 RepID=A0ABD2KIA9_9BILA
MAPHKSKLRKMDERNGGWHTFAWWTPWEHNVKHAEELKADKANNENKALGELRQETKKRQNPRRSAHGRDAVDAKCTTDLERERVPSPSREQRRRTFAVAASADRHVATPDDEM